MIVLRWAFLDYSEAEENLSETHTVQLHEEELNKNTKGNIAFIGAGNYASRVLIPAFRKAGANLKSLVTSGGVSAVHYGKKNNFEIASTDIEQALHEKIDAVVIATQHNLHASQTILALEKNKHVFVEKPLALTLEEIDRVEEAQKASKGMIMVGYNRRFSPHIKKIKSLLDKKSTPKPSS